MTLIQIADPFLEIDLDDDGDGVEDGSDAR